MILFTGTSQKDRRASDDIYWALLEDLNSGDLTSAARAVSTINAHSNPKVADIACWGFKSRFMDAYVHPFGALKTDLAISIWQLRGQTNHLEMQLESLTSASTDILTLSSCYPAQMLKFLLGQQFQSDYFSTTDRLTSEVSDLFEAPLEYDQPFEGNIDNIFQRSEAYFLSYNGNIIFDVLALLLHVKAGPDAFDAAAVSAEMFREQIIAGSLENLAADQKLGSLAFLMPIYPKLFEIARTSSPSDNAAASRLYDEARKIAGSRS